MIQQQSLSFETQHPELYVSLKKLINQLAQSSATVRKQAVKGIYRLLIQQNNQFSPAFYQQLSNQFLKNLLKAASDQSEVVRETAVLLVTELLARCEETDGFLPYIFSVLVDRTNCSDLEGVASLPQVMRPPPGQKPKVVIKLVQQTEEIRLLYCRLLQKILGLVEADVLRKYLDDVINIIRALVMDPFGDVQRVACETLHLLCINFKDILLHYTEIMGRALLLPLISKKSKIRIAALESLTSVLWCGIWKYNAFVFENLVGFRDPNSVPIKDFYNPSININYLATLIVDPNVRVRQAFMKCLNQWICKLDDKYDHHARLIPYVLSGLFDADEGVKKLAYDTLEQIGAIIEYDKQKQFRESKQYAIDAAWTWNGKLVSMPIRPPFVVRPRLGSRFFVRGHIRKYWSAIFKQIKDINLENRIRAANLSLMGIIYTQNHMTTHMDKFIPHFLASLSSPDKDDIPVCKLVAQCFYYIGRYCEYSSYSHIMKSGLKGEFIQNPEYIRSSFIGLSRLLQGSLDAIPEGTGLAHKRQQICDILNTFNQLDLYSQVSAYNSAEVESLIIVILEKLQKKATQKQLDDIFANYYSQICKLAYVVYYEKYLGKDMVVVMKEIKTRLVEKEPLIQILIPLHQKYYEPVINQALQDIFMNPPSFVDSAWKFLIGQYILQLDMNGAQKQSQTILDVISQSLQYNKIPDMMDFVLKLIIIVLSERRYQGTLVQLSTKLLLSCSQNLSKYRPQKKLPKYIEAVKTNTDKPEEPNPEQITLADTLFYIIFDHFSQCIDQLQIRKLDVDQSILAGIIDNYLECVKKVRKQKELIETSVRTVWAVFERVDLASFKPDKFKYQGRFLIPKVVDYLVERLETLPTQSNSFGFLFATFNKIAESMPKCTTLLSTLPYHYPNYPDLYDKLFQYRLDEKNAENRSRFQSLLVKLCEKMPSWFEEQLRQARSRNRFKRVELIEQILSAAHK